VDYPDSQALATTPAEYASTAHSTIPSSMERWLKLKPEHGPGIVIYAGETYQPLSANVRAMPASLLF